MSTPISGPGGTGAPPMVTGASWSGPPQQKFSSLFDSIDTAGSGSITKSQFQTAFQTKSPPAAFKQLGVDAVYAQLDPKGSGQISKSTFVSVMSGLSSSLRSQSSDAGAAQTVAASSASLQALKPSSSDPAVGGNVDKSV